MDVNQAFAILGIEKVKDENIIKNAYRTNLPKYNPEDDAEGFKMLREAFEVAKDYAKESDEKTEDSNENSKTIDEFDPVKKWMEEVSAIYDDILKRRDINCYTELFEREIVDDLDYSDRVRYEFLTYTLNHYRIPRHILQYISKRLGIENAKSDLYKEFPYEFINYISFSNDDQYYFNYDLFEIVGDNPQPEEFFNDLQNIAVSLNEKKDINKAKIELNTLKTRGLYHPDIEINEMMIMNESGDKTSAISLGKDIIKRYPNDDYTVFSCANILYEMGEKEEATKYITALFEKNPKVLAVKFAMVKIYYDNKEYKQAKELAQEVVEGKGYEQECYELLKKINEEYNDQLMKDYNETNDAHKLVDIAWGLFQNTKLDECVELLRKIESDVSEEYDFINLLGRCLYALKNYKEALPVLLKWNQMIIETKSDDPQKDRRVKRLGLSYELISLCYRYLGNREEAIKNNKLSIENENDLNQKLGYYNALYNIYYDMSAYDLAIDCCNEALNQAENYYLMIFLRQKAYAAMRDLVSVRNDYDLLVSIAPFLSGTYYYFISCAIDCDYYDLAADIIKVTKEREVFDADLHFLELKLKALSDETVDKNEIIKELQEYAEDLKKTEEDNRIVTLDVVYMQLYDLLDYNSDMNEFYIKSAIEIEQFNASYYWVYACYLLDQIEYDRAKDYDKAVDRAVDICQKYYDLSNNDSGGAVILGYAYIYKKEFERSIELFDEAKSRNNPSSKLYMGYVRAYKERYEANYKIEDVENFKVAAKEFIEKFPNYNYQWYDLIDDYISFKMFSEGLELSMKIINDNPEDLYSNMRAGICYEGLNDTKNANEKYQASYRIMKQKNMNSPWVLNTLASFYEKIKSYDLALTYAKECYEARNNYEGYFRRVIRLNSICHKESDNKNVIERARAHVDLKPASINVYNAYSDLLGGHDKMALLKLMRYKKSDDYSLGLYITIMMDYYRKFRIAHDELKDFLEIENTFNCYIGLTNMARCAFFCGQMDLAKIHTKMVFDMLGLSFEEIKNDYLRFGNEDMYEIMAELYLFSGETQKAEEILSITPKSVSYYVVCGFIAEVKGDIPKAIESYKKALELNPYDFRSLGALRALKKK